MCGITGYAGGRGAVTTAIDNLKRLEYRGYDSAGVAFPNSTHIDVVRATGKIVNLERAIQTCEEQDTAHHSQPEIAIAHTRWATHGRPTEANAHPHRDCTGRIAVVHNGIIENYEELRRELIARGHEFVSDTDTEVLAHLIEEQVSAQRSQMLPDSELTANEISAAVRAAVAQLRGSYAIAAILQDVPDTVFVARKDSPLVIGLGNGENFLASDIAAVIRHTRRVILLEDGDFAMLTRSSVRVTDMNGSEMERAAIDVLWDDALAEKSGFDHFMIKEIFDAPRTVRETLRGRLLDSGEVALPAVALTSEQAVALKQISIVGCGTAYNAGVVGKRLMEQILRKPVEVTVASEFRYGDPLVDSDTLVILLSQSGETADTLAAMREAKSKGAYTLAVVNVVGSTLARESDAILLTQAGPEIGVASTKAYLAQLTALALLTLYLHQAITSNTKAVIRSSQVKELTDALRGLPHLLETCLQRSFEIETLARSLASNSCFFFLGRGYDYAVALEAALKLKEISYLHAEAYAAGEMKHGPLALVEPGVVVVGLCTQTTTRDKMLSNLQEVKAREGTVLGVIRDTDPGFPGLGADSKDCTIRVPDTMDALMPVLTMVPMQLLAYYIARERGCEIDQPRNLAKSVTVE
jgi:glucosamine--fructose-6-phosphate aminotransferase (isomerizing)